MNSKVLIVAGLVAAAFYFGGGFGSIAPTMSGGDDARATAAVSYTVAAMEQNSPTPNPSPTPGPKPPRKDCIYCKGTGVIVHGDGHKSPCPHCEPNSPDPFVVTDNKCCPHCDCGKDCNCEYRGQCLVEANGGEPVKICDERGCGFYAAPSFEFPKAQPPIDTSAVPQLEALMTETRTVFATGDYKKAFALIKSLEQVLLPLPDNSVYAEYRKRVLYARMNLDRKMDALDKAEYKKFIEDYNSYIESNNIRLEELLTIKQFDLQEQDSCSNGSCDTGGGYGAQWGNHSFMRYGEGRPAYSFESFAPQRFLGRDSGGTSCSSCQ